MIAYTFENALLNFIDTEKGEPAYKSHFQPYSESIYTKKLKIHTWIL